MTDADFTVGQPMKKKAASMLAATTAVANPAINNAPLSKEFYNPVTYSNKAPTNSVNAAKTTPLTGTFMDPKVIPVTPQGMGNNAPAVPVKSDADIYKEKLQAAAEQEAIRRRTAASNLYNSTLSNLDAESAGIEPMFNETIETINKGEFNLSESQKELMNANGWGMADSGLAVGEVGKIAIGAKKSRDDTAIKRDQALVDIARRKSLAAMLRDQGIEDADAWRSAQMMGVEAEAFLKAKEMAKADEKLKYDKQIADATLGIQKDDLQLRKDDFALKKKTSEETSKMTAAEIFTKNTGLSQITDSMIDPKSSLRNTADYQAAINKIQSDPNWMNDPAARYNFAALMTLRNQKINAMKDTDPESYNKYKDSINLNGELMSTLPNVQWYKQFQSGENQRAFDNNLKTETLEENKRSNLADEGIRNAAAKVAASKTTSTQTKTDLNKSFGEDYKDFKSMSWNDAANNMKNNADSLIAAYGYDGYKELWNSVMADAIKGGHSQPIETTPKVPKNDDIDLGSILKQYGYTGG